MFLRRFAWLAAAVLVVAGCQKETQEIGGVPREGGIPSIVSLSPSTSELVGKLSFQSLLKGRTAEDDFPQSVLNAPIVMKGTTPDYEQIASINPQYIVYDVSLFSADEIQKIEELGAETLPFDATTLEEYMDYCYRLANKMGGETNMSEYLDKVYNAAEAAKGSAPEIRPRTAVLMGSGGRYMSAGTDSFLASLITLSGGEVIGPSGKIFADMSVESLVAADPHIIISNGSAAEIMKDPRFAGTWAVKNNRVVDIEGDVLLRAGGRVEQLIEGLSTLMTNTAGSLSQ